jgi:hypothetical protein
MENKKIFEAIIDQIGEYGNKYINFYKNEVYPKEILQPDEDYDHLIMEFIVDNNIIEIKTNGLIYCHKILNYNIGIDTDDDNGLIGMYVNIMCPCYIYDPDHDNCHVKNCGMSIYEHCKNSYDKPLAHRKNYNNNLNGIKNLVKIIKQKSYANINKILMPYLDCPIFQLGLKKDISNFMYKNKQHYYIESIYYFLGNGWLDGVEGLINLKKYINQQFDCVEDNRTQKSNYVFNIKINTSTSQNAYSYSGSGSDSDSGSGYFW